jgi:predicted RNA-binding Zn ribbon-like protein
MTMTDFPKPPPAPDDLRLVQAFLNTASRKPDSEELTSPEALAQHLSSLRLLPPGTQLTQADLERAVEVREALRSLVFANSGAKLSDEAVARLDKVASSVAIELHLGSDGRAHIRSAGEGFERVLGQLFEIVAEAQVHDLWSRFKACDSPTCRQLFFDTSIRSNGKWCVPRCGVRFRAQNLRRRHGAVERPKARSKRS